MKTILKNIYLVLSAIIAVAMATACDDDSNSGLMLEGDTRVESIVVSGYHGTVNHEARTISVNVPVDVNLSSLKVDAISLSPGATCDLPQGSTFNGLVPRAIKVLNGSVTASYTLTVKHDNVEFLSFTVNNEYAGTIDNVARTILVFVPVDADVTAMQVSFVVTDGTSVEPASGSLLDFSSPVVFTATLRSAVVRYTVTVVRDEMSQAPKAFIGNAASVDLLGDEARTACRWMLDNVPNSRYVAITDLIGGAVKLDDFKMIWCHFDWTDWPGQLWDSRDIFNGYWLRGGAILASRDGARYINDVWRIARDQQSPNNMFGGDTSETLSDDLGFTITGHESHPIYDGIATDGSDRIILLAKGCSNTNRTLQWGVDWEPYGSMAGWEERTGAKALASGHDYDINRVTIAEFEPYEALKGYQSGRVVTIGTPSYEWYDRNGTDNPYRENMVKLTKNTINYLCQ